MFSLYNKLKMMMNNKTPKVNTNNTATPSSNTTNTNSANWQQWQGKVMGTEEDIKTALDSEAFKNKPPINIQELQQVISQQRRTKLNQTFEQGKNSFW